MGRDGSADDPKAARGTRSLLWILVAAIALAVLLPLLFSSSGSSNQIPYAEFRTQVIAGQVKQVMISQSSGAIDGTYVNGKTFSTQGPPGGMPDTDIDLLNAHGVARDYRRPSGSSWLPALFLYGLPIFLIIGFWIWMSRRAQSQLAGYSRIASSQAKVHRSERSKTLFSDIAGYEGVKQEIREVVDYLTDPSRYRDIGARIPKGVLLVGPPGTGKTLFARAIAGEAGVPFISITGSQFMEMFVGVGAARVRDLFKTARKETPSMIFVDEIDAIGRKRGTGLGGGHDEREQTLNQLLAEMDGFEVNEGIIVLAATNRPDILDSALLRPGRFDRQVVIPLPTLEERTQILKVHCRDKKIAGDVDLALVARGTPGMSGAELANLVNEAALIAVRRDGKAVGAADLDAARDRVLMGLQRTSLALSEHERDIVAHHEAGHAVVAELLEGADPVHKVTILPTGLALGVTQQLPEQEHVVAQRTYLEDSLAVRLGGRAAEELVFGVPSTGAEDDLVGATELARRMVREWGMSDRVGQMAWGAQGPVFLGEDIIHTRDYSEQTARVIDEEVKRILAEQAERAGRLLSGHRPALEAVAAALLTHESLDGAEVASLVAGAEAAPAA